VRRANGQKKSTVLPEIRTVPRFLPNSTPLRLQGLRISNWFFSREIQPILQPQCVQDIADNRKSGYDFFLGRSVPGAPRRYPTRTGDDGSRFLLSGRDVYHLGVKIRLAARARDSVRLHRQSKNPSFRGTRRKARKVRTCQFQGGSILFTFHCSML
jgi:hypothetical protein